MTLKKSLGKAFTVPESVGWRKTIRLAKEG